MAKKGGKKMARMPSAGSATSTKKNDAKTKAKGKSAPHQPERHLSVAFSDLVLCATSAFCAKICWEKDLIPQAVLFYGLIGAAAFAGVLRFGVAPSLFFPLHKTLVHYSTGISIAALAFSICARKMPLFIYQATKLAPNTFVWTLGALLLVLCPTMPYLNHVITMSGIISAIYTATPSPEHPIQLADAGTLVGFALVVVGALINLGPDSLLCVRKEDWFHYLFAIAHIMFLFALAT
eukprot:TRINITY_DN6375_c0_g1_i1.p1 TRINITY_DN6375_c0_g1~~TRINITY_DN6375_c0_g1_i1.p1  ORF type:complete len:236 (-),score=70.27 TRINITY_DN6375_c0_g1_i1:158-865(-)